MIEFWLQFALVLTAILIGIRRGGVALGLISGLGVALLSFGFRAAPSEPPITVMLIILAVVTASATLQVAGGLDYLVRLAERLTIMLPFGLALGLSPYLLLGLIPSCYSYFFFAFYPSDLAAINMDRSGTTRIGKYLLNHSFMIPGWIGVIVSTIVAYGLAQIYF